VPVFNGEDYLAEALDSIFGQSYTAIECIVVDDGSDDRTASIVSDYSGEISYFYQENQGPAAARNLGLEHVRGEYIAFLDADDLWHEHKTERQVECFETRPELDYCTAKVQNFWIPELREEAERLKDHPRSRPMSGSTTASLLARRTLFDRIGRFDPSLQHCDATEWFLRVQEEESIGDELPDTFVYRRMHHNNRSRRLARNSQLEFSRLLKARLDRKRRGTAETV
jgi:glycosyltransferase involved in cell wall biosynthesis